MSICSRNDSVHGGKWIHHHIHLHAYTQILPLKFIRILAMLTIYTSWNSQLYHLYKELTAAKSTGLIIPFQASTANYSICVLNMLFSFSIQHFPETTTSQVLSAYPIAMPQSQIPQTKTERLWGSCGTFWKASAEGNFSLDIPYYRLSWCKLTIPYPCALLLWTLNK